MQAEPLQQLQEEQGPIMSLVFWGLRVGVVEGVGEGSLDLVLVVCGVVVGFERGGGKRRKSGWLLMR